VNANTAKLLEKRFADTASAMELLEENLSVDEPSVEEHARIELARLHFDQRNYFKVVDLLSKDYEGQWSSTFNEQRELFGQLMLCFALETLGEKDRARRQFERVTYLHQVISPIDLS